MKVLAANKYYFVKGGAERYMFELERILERHGHSVVPFAMQHELNEETEYSEHFVSFESFEGGAPVSSRLRAAGRVLYSVEARRKIERLVDIERPDVAHLHNIAHQLSPSILYGLRAKGVPVVQTLHDYKLVCPNYQMFVGGRPCERCAGGKYYNAVLHRCMRGSVPASALVALETGTHRLLRSYSRGVDLFVSPSEELRRRMIAHGVDEGKIVHLPYAIALERYEPRYGSDGYGVYVGRLSDGKGLDTLVSALSMAREVTFKIVGSGPLTRRLKQAVAAEGLDRVEFLGYREGEDLRSIVGGALFVAVPSECYENSPLTVYEAFARGKVVIGSRIGGIPELVSEGESGLLFEPGSAPELAERMTELWRDPDRAIAMGRAARDRVERLFGPETHYDKMMAIYERVIN